MSDVELEVRPCARCGSTNTSADRWTTTPYSFKPKDGYLQFLCPECWKIEKDAYEAFSGHTVAGSG